MMPNSFERRLDESNSVIFCRSGMPDVLVYGGHRENGFYEAFYCQGYDVLTGTRTRQFKKIAARLLHYCHDQGSVLDVGCGNGLFVNIFQYQRPDCKVMGIDPGCSSETKFVKKSDLFGCTETNIDLLTFFDVFEHFQHPKEVLTKIDTLLARDGNLVLKIPSKSSFLYRLARFLLFLHIPAAREVMARMYQIGFPPPHYFFYDLRSLKSLLEESGYKIREHFFVSEIFVRELSNRTWGLKGSKKILAILALIAIRLLSFGSLKDSLVVRAQKIREY